MPYKVVGSDVYHKKDGKWSVKQHCKTPASAHSAMRLLNGVEHGMKPKVSYASLLEKRKNNAD